MKEVSIIKYEMQNCIEKQKTALKRAMNGYRDYSNNGIYTYKRKGILNKIPHKRISRAVIMVDKKQKSKILSILRTYGASYKIINLYSKG